MPEETGSHFVLFARSETHEKGKQDARGEYGQLHQHTVKLCRDGVNAKVTCRQITCDKERIQLARRQIPDDRERDQRQRVDEHSAKLGTVKKGPQLYKWPQGDRTEQRHYGRR